MKSRKRLNIKNKKSIKNRILRNTLILVITILIGIGVAFNILVNRYIYHNANDQLDVAINIIENYEVNEEIKPKLYENYTIKKSGLLNESSFTKYIKHLIKMIKENSSVEGIIVDEDYNMLMTQEEVYYMYDIDDISKIVKEVEEHNKSIKKISGKQIYIKDKNYYISVLNINKTYEGKENYIILFTDTTEQLELSRKINILLFIIMFVAAILTFFTTILLSEKISKPIKEISKFAQKIGSGDFSKSDMEFEDKELDDLLQVMNKSAEYLGKCDEDQKIFFQNISHELRTPLMSIVGYAEAIKYNIMDTDEANNIILEESDKLKNMIEELLYISKMDNITQDYKISTCDLREVLSNCVQSKQGVAINKNIKFICNFTDNQVIYSCDEKSISRAFLNIIDNALRYAKSTIEIGCKLNHDKIIIEIADDGPGINEKDLPYIFDRFYKGEKGINGIGLSIVKSIIKNHKGEIYCQNSSEGVKFTIEFEYNNLDIT